MTPGYPEQLDETDHRIATLVALGLPSRVIAERVCLSYQTVRNRISRIFDITGVSNRTQLALWWTRINLSEPDADGRATPEAPLSPVGHDAGGDLHP